MNANIETGLIRLARKKGLIDDDTSTTLLKKLDGEGATAAYLLTTKGGVSEAKILELLEEQRRQSIPSSFDGYRVTGVIGRGGMSVVLKAIRDSDGQVVALKLLSPKVVNSREARSRFHREIRSGAGLTHPNVIACFGSGEVNGLPYLALEYMAGGDTAMLLAASKGPLSEERVLAIAACCARGLAAIEKAGLVHRDIKPSNIFLDQHGLAKLADLGLAKSQTATEQLTMIGHCVGTPVYMSPEQVMGDRELDVRSDIYCLGATLYHLATGSPPFAGESPMQIMRKVASDQPSPPNLLNPGLSRRTTKLIITCMQKDREKRFQTPTALGQAVQEAIAKNSKRIKKVSDRRAKAAAPAAIAKPARRPWWKRLLGRGRIPKQG